MTLDLSAVKFGNNGHEKYSAGCGNYRNFNWELEETDKVSDDILNLLPSDPFGMDISSTFTAITGWLEDFENELDLNSLGYGTDQVEVETGEDRLFAGLNWVLNGEVKFHMEVDDSEIEEVSIGSDNELLDGLCDGDLLLDGNLDKFMGFDEKYWVSSNSAKEFQGCTVIQLDGDGDGDGGAPHDALLFSLGYLGMRDLISVEMVCKSLRDAVRNDPLLWRSIYIDQPLSEKTTDDALLQLTSRAQGTLQSLSLVDCLRITDNGLRQVLESNPGMTKLSVPGCVRLSAESILCNLKAFNSANKLGIKHLRIGGLHGVTDKQFEELNFVLGADNHRQPTAHKPRFYHGGHLYLSCDDDRAIDIEPCPRCQKLRQVYDCPAESCQEKRESNQLCRACTFCIARCTQCGRCISGCDYEETFCLDFLCLDCCKHLLNCQNRQEEMGSHYSKCIVFHQQARYHFCLYG